MEAVVFAVVGVSAALGDLLMPVRRGKPALLTGWAGASVGALFPLLLLNCLVLFPFALDPVYMVVQEILLAGIVGAVVDLPVLVFRNGRAGVPLRRHLAGPAALVLLAGVLAVAWAVFRRVYRPTELPI
jgi:hypothetical protein